MSLATQILLKVTSNLQSALDLVTAAAPLVNTKTVTLTSGTGANQADQMWCDRITLAGEGTEDLDLSALTNALGDTVAYSKVKALVIHAAAGNVNDVVVGAAVSNPWAAPFSDTSDTIRVAPGGSLVLVAPNATGYAVAADSSDILRCANGDLESGDTESVTFDVILVGVEST